MFSEAFVSKARYAPLSTFGTVSERWSHLRRLSPLFGGGVEAAGEELELVAQIHNLWRRTRSTRGRTRIQAAGPTQPHQVNYTYVIQDRISPLDVNVEMSTLRVDIFR